jgi:hypothetical protein
VFQSGGWNILAARTTRELPGGRGVGAGIGSLASWCEGQGLGGRETQRVELPGRRRLLGLAHPGGVVGVIGQAGAVLEKLTDGDLASGRYDGGQVAAPRGSSRPILF